MKKIIIALLIVFLLSGCSPKITEGEVIKKEHNQAWTQLVILPMIISNGKTSTTIFVPYWIFHPENWNITIKGLDKNQTEVTETFYITKEVYSKIEIGNIFKYDKKIASTGEKTYKIKKNKEKDEDFEGYQINE